MSKITRRQLVRGVVPGAVAGALLDPFHLDAASGLQIVKDGADFRFVSGTTIVARIPAVAQGDANSAVAQVKFGAVGAGKATRTFQSGSWDVSEQIRRIQPGFYEWKRTWKNHTSQPVQADLAMEIETGYSPEFTLVPGISYNGNPEYGRNAVKGLGENGTPWIFSAFRSNIPAGNYSEGGGWSTYVFTSVERKSLYCAFSLHERNQKLAHRLLWPERDTIATNRPPAGRAPSAPIKEELTLAPGQEFAVTAYVVLSPAVQKRRAFAVGTDHAWRLNRKDVKPSFPPQRLWELGTQYARESLWYDKEDFTGFSWGLDREGEKWVQRHQDRGQPSGRFEIGWCNQNAGMAAVLLQDYILHKNEESLAKGEKALDFWANNGRLPCGLFHTHWDAKLGKERWAYHNATFLGRPAKPGEYFLDTCNLGFGAYYYLLASELAEKMGKPKPVWRQLGIDACNFFVDHVLPDGTFGKAWSLQGECLAPGYTTGAHILWPMVKAYKMTKDARYLQAARRGFRAYVDRDLDRLTCTGGAIDADTIDREAGVPLMLAAMDLYDITGEKEYLRDAELAAYYLATWQWHYALPIHPDSPIVPMHYEWFAGTGITVMAQSQDPWGSLWAYAWLRLAKATGKDIWRDRAIQCWNQGTRGISDGTMVIHGVKRPIGSQEEAYGLRLQTPEGKRFYGDSRDWLVAWPSVHRLHTLMNWPNWKDFEV
ncbi:MAG: hypothetical protein ABI759_23200 [Candidatus Solibacter sp.]